MTNLIWTRQMSLGNLVIDAGHRNMLGLVNNLEYAIRRRDMPQLSQLFEQFCDYAQLHFRDEEKIIRAVKLPFVPHKLEHQYLLDELQHTRNGLITRHDSWPEYVMDHYPEFLKDWLVSHIKHGITTLKPVLESQPYDFMPAQEADPRFSAT